MEICPRTTSMAMTHTVIMVAKSHVTIVQDDCPTFTPLRNTIQTKMKVGLLQILYDNHFAELDHEDMYIHLTKFYELLGTLGALEI